MSDTEKPVKMDRERLLSLLAELAKNDDDESARIEADQAMIDYIGDPEITAAYDAVGKWYS